MKRAIINNEYVVEPSDEELSANKRFGDGAEYRRTNDREAHYKDLIQPYIGGKMNKNFVKAYPDRARDYFTEDELKNL